MSDYIVQNTEGYELAGPWSVLDEAVDGAVALLKDDPELRELTVWEFDPSGNLVTHRKTITHGPDANWDTVIVVLDPGEHVRAPAPVPHRITEDDLDAYELGDPKRITLERHLGEWI